MQMFTKTGTYNEERLLKQLNHPNIIKLQSSSTIPGGVLLKFEYLKKGSLEA